MLFNYATTLPKSLCTLHFVEWYQNTYHNTKKKSMDHTYQSRKWFFPESLSRSQKVITQEHVENKSLSLSNEFEPRTTCDVLICVMVHYWWGHLHKHNRWTTGTIHNHTRIWLAVCGHRNIVFCLEDGKQVHHIEEGRVFEVLEVTRTNVHRYLKMKQ